MIVQKVYTRGLNFLGQCGLGKKANYIEQFTQVKNLPLELDSVYTNYGGSYVLSADKKEVFYFGNDWDVRSFLRIINAYNSIPKTMTFVKGIWPAFKNQSFNPCILHKFLQPIKEFNVGGSFALAVNTHHKVHGIGDNYWVSQ